MSPDPTSVANAKNRQHMNPIRVISVTSGKGGVGKTNVVTNLAMALASAGQKVLVWDADLGLANIDVLLGLKPEFNIQHLLNGEKSLREILVEGPGGFKIMPASSGIQELSHLGEGQKVRLLSELDEYDDDLDYLLIDTGAGISSNVMYFNMAAQERIVVVTPEPTSITDAYALIKVMSTPVQSEKICHTSQSGRQCQRSQKCLYIAGRSSRQTFGIDIPGLSWLHPPRSDGAQISKDAKTGFARLSDQ